MMIIIIIGAMASQITSLTIAYSTVYPGTDRRKHQSSASLASVRGIHRSPVNSPHKGPVTQEMSPVDDVIMTRETHLVLVKEDLLVGNWGHWVKIDSQAPLAYTSLQLLLRDPAAGLVASFVAAQIEFDVLCFRVNNWMLAGGIRSSST